MVKMKDKPKSFEQTSVANNCPQTTKMKMERMRMS